MRLSGETLARRRPRLRPYRLQHMQESRLPRVRTSCYTHRSAHRPQILVHVLGTSGVRLIRANGSHPTRRVFHLCVLHHLSIPDRIRPRLFATAYDDITRPSLSHSLTDSLHTHTRTHTHTHTRVRTWRRLAAPTPTPTTRVHCVHPTTRVHCVHCVHPTTRVHCVVCVHCVRCGATWHAVHLRGRPPRPPPWCG